MVPSRKKKRKQYEDENNPSLTISQKPNRNLGVVVFQDVTNIPQIQVDEIGQEISPSKKNRLKATIGLRRLKNRLRQAGINRTSSSIEGIIDTQNNITNQTTTEKFGTILNILNDTNASKEEHAPVRRTFGKPICWTQFWSRSK
ncbi:hypothetical protein IGI04_035907 [Brassica rapa subsp. trilocularis]|uniref:Uncharacterized protein n=1 Tax=Brassica rapa subsp. trilocularis TaxID=1813537 RepID=A0ABQ7LCY1_BRACM|nr:hypothetical protein IGI04_035907 [Brassica rapa subsp. trilocularis]